MDRQTWKSKQLFRLCRCVIGSNLFLEKKSLYVALFYVLDHSWMNISKKLVTWNWSASFARDNGVFPFSSAGSLFSRWSTKYSRLPNKRRPPNKHRPQKSSPNEYALDCPKNELSSQIKNFTLGTNFSHSLGQKQYKKLKIESVCNFEILFSLMTNQMCRLWSFTVP